MQKLSSVFSARTFSCCSDTIVTKIIFSETHTISSLPVIRQENTAFYANQTALLYGISCVSASQSFPSPKYSALFVELFIKLFEYSLKQELQKISFALILREYIKRALKNQGSVAPVLYPLFLLSVISESDLMCYYRLLVLLVSGLTYRDLPCRKTVQYLYLLPTHNHHSDSRVLV